MRRIVAVLALVAFGLGGGCATTSPSVPTASTPPPTSASSSPQQQQIKSCSPPPGGGGLVFGFIGAVNTLLFGIPGPWYVNCHDGPGPGHHGFRHGTNIVNVPPDCRDAWESDNPGTFRACMEGYRQRREEIQRQMEEEAYRRGRYGTK